MSYNKAYIKYIQMLKKNSVYFSILYIIILIININMIYNNYFFYEPI